MKNLGFILLAFFLTTSAIAGNTISTSDLLVHPNDTVDLSIAIDNDLPMIAYQFDVELPIGIRLAKQFDLTVEDSLYAAFLTDRKDSSHLLNVTSLGHSYRFLAYSSINKAFKTGSGNAVVTIRLIVDSTIAQGSFNLMIRNALYTTGETEAMTIPLADFSSTINVIYRYQISLSSSGNGSVAGAGLFNHGDSARIVATPQTGYSFTGWYNGEQLFSARASYTFILTASMALEARFVLNTYTINLTAQAGGSVSGSGTISHGDSAKIVATPQAGYSFTGWYDREQLFSALPSFSFFPANSVSLEARFALNTYTINLTAQAGGSVSGSGTISHGDSARIVATPQTGYSFTGWYDGEQLFSPNASYAFMPTASMALEARFVLNTYTINLTAQAGGSVSGSGTISHGDSAKIVATIESGYSFIGWYNGEQLFSPNASYAFMPTASMALEARFALNTYTINLTAQAGGSVSGSGTISHGDSAKIVATPQAGYSFTGWYDREQLFSALPSFSFFPANSVSLEARFALNTYTINLTAQAGGSVSGSGTISHGDSARIVATPQTGYSFTGWYDGEQLFSPNASYAFMPTASMALEARFVLNTYTINLTAQAGGSVSGSGTISHGDSAKIVATIESGYSFIGWYNGEQLFSPNASYAFMPTASMALEARFVLNTYTINLTAQAGGSVSGSGTISHGDSASIVATPQAGYSFIGWYNEGQLFSTLPSFSFFPANSVSLDARFALNTYTINLTAQAGGSVSGSGTISHGDSAKIVATIESGYSFIGWYNGEQLFSPNASYTFMPTASMALEARFVLNTYTINLTAQAGGSVSGSGTISHGDSAKIVATIESGYSFIGWYNGEQLFSPNASYAFMPTASMALEARFALNTYTINLTAQAGGSVSGSGTISHGDSARIVATPQTGYSFTGWYDGEQLFSPNASYAFMPTASMALEARFVLNTYTINLTAQAGGSVSGSGTISHGDSAKIVATIESGYSFIGWYNGEQLFSPNASYAFMPTASMALEARFALNTYTINLTAQAGGSVSGSGTISHGDSARIVATIESGYSFIGWYNGEQLFSPNASYAFMPTASMALEARFVLNTYTINLTAQAGGSVSGSGTISHGDSARIVATPQTGYSFTGWYDGEQLFSPNASYTFMPTASMALEARFVLNTYTINLTAQAGGSVSGSGTISHGDSAKIVATPQAGYSFTGWYNGEQLFSPNASYAFMPTASMALEARFALNTYTINLTAQAGGSVSGSGTISHGDSAKIVATPQAGYSFTGWYNGEQLFSPNASYAFMPTASMALEARFALNTYTINLTAQAGGSVSGSGTISHGDSARIVATPQTGYSFTGWYDGEQLFSPNASYAFMPTASMALEARFALNTYTINLTAQAGGSVSGSGTISHGDSARIVATIESGYSFIGWYNGEQLFSPNASYAFMPTASMALEARFVLNTYTINLTAQAGGSVSGSGTISHGDSARIVATPQTGYSFTGWYDGEQLFSPNASYTFMPTASMALEARFVLNTYTINLTAQAGGSVSGSGTISHGDSAKIVATPQAGYSFTGWYDREQLFSALPSFSFFPANSVSLEARFALNTYTINLTAQAGGSVSGSGTISHGDSARIVATPQTGYSFTGWYDGEQLFSPNASYAFMPTASMALEARFVLNTYTINLTAQAGGSVSGSGTISHGDSASIVATPQAGYSFIGWYNEGQLFSPNASYAFMPTASMALEARFVLNTYTINLTAQAGGSVSGSGTISHGDSASIVATPQAGYSFIGWYNEGQLFSTLPSFSFFPANSVSLDARFALNTYTINLTAQAGGSVSGSGTISHGDSARIVATPQTGYSFTGWYDGEQLFSPNASYTFMPTASMALEARFVLNTYTINLTAQAGGSVSGSGTISHGDSARIVATPQAGYSFTGWYDREQLFSALPSFSFFPANSVSLEARFVLNTYTINLTAQAGGSVSGSGTISHGDSAKIVATIESGYSFIGWYNGEQLFSPNASYAFMPTASMALEARFALNTYTINLTAQAGGSVSGSGTISHGDSARIVATPQTGYSFTGWYDGEQLFSPNASYTFMPTASISLAALFKKRQLKPIINNQNGIVTITTEDEADSLYYTLDSSTPTIYSSKYDKPFTLEYSCIIKAISHKESMGDSEIATLFATVFKHDTLTVTVRDTLVQTKTDTVFLLRTDTIHHFVHDTLEMMVLPLAPIITNRGDSVFITCETEGVVIYYSTDGTTNLNQLYTGPFVITNERTIIAKTVIESIKTMANIPMDLTKISRTKVSQRYYQLNGIETQVLMKGINIVCTVYDDGTTDSIKVFVK